MIKSTKYLYDITPNSFAFLPYVEALEFKISAANTLLTQLLTPHFTKRDYIRIGDVINAIKFNQSLLKELKC